MSKKAEKPDKSKKEKALDVQKEILRLEYSFERGINFSDRVIQVTGEIQDRLSFDYMDAALSEMERANKKSITVFFQ